MANLLDEASILLTPTAYNNGRMLAVKPEIAFGGELIVNGDFSDGTNNWINNNSTLSVVNGKVKVLSSSAYGNAEQNILVESGKTYRVLVDFTYGGAIEGRLNLYDGSAAPIETSKSEDGIISTQITISSGQTNLRVRLVNQSATTGVYNFWDNVSVKEDLSGDFTFSRNSAATRVNAQGLVENVQILSSNLVSNGDFSQEGSELVTGTNSDMSGANSWVDGIGSLDFNINTTVPNKMWCNFTSGNQQVKLNNVITANKTYLVSLSARLNSGTATTIQIGDFTSNQSDAGILNITPTATTTTYSGYIVSGANVNLSIGIITANNNGSDYEFDNISVKEVGQDWTLGTGWSIGEDKAICDGTQTGDTPLRQNDVFTSGNSYKLTFDFIGNGQDFKFWVNGSQNIFSSALSDGSKEYYFTASVSGKAYFEATSSFIGSITNISLIEITDDTNLPRINYEGFSYQDSLGSELVTNGDFSSGSTGWNVGASWTIDNGFATSNGGQSFLTQNVGFVVGLTYLVTFNINRNSGNLFVRDSSGVTKLIINENNDTTLQSFYFTSTSSGIINFYSYDYNGSIDNVSVKEYLGQEVVPNSGCGSWLLEPQSTNLITQSEDFSNSYWTKSGASVVSGFTSPDGTTNAFKLVEGANTGTHFTQARVPAASTSSHTIYVYAKANTRNRITLTNWNNSTQYAGATFDLINGVVVGTILGSAKIETMTNGWYKCSITGTPPSTSLGYQQITIGSDTATGSGLNSYTGDGTSGVYIYGAQLEQQSYATSYIPTQGASSTRLADIATNSGNASLINSEEGTLYVETQALIDSGSTRYLSLTDGTSSNRMSIVFGSSSNQIRFLVYNGVVQSDIQTFSYSQTDINKIAFRYAQNNFSLWVNGVKVGENLSGDVFALNTLSFDLGNNSLNWIGKTKALAVYKTALTDAQLTALTTI